MPSENNNQKLQQSLEETHIVRPATIQIDSINRKYRNWCWRGCDALAGGLALS